MNSDPIELEQEPEAIDAVKLFVDLEPEGQKSLYYFLAGFKARGIQNNMQKSEPTTLHTNK